MSHASQAGRSWGIPWALISPLLAVAAALGVGAGLIVMAKSNPLVAYTALFRDSLLSYYGFANTLTRMAPLLLAGLSVAVALRARQFNIGGEGQIYVGGLGSALVGLSLSGWPGWIHMPLALLGGFVAGSLWGLLPGYCKAYLGVNEVITTLLLNYIAQYLVSYMVTGPLIEPGAPMPYSPLVADTARLPIFLPQTQAHGGIFLGLALVVGLAILLQRTPLGYQIEAVGLNPIAAYFAGIPVKRIIVLVMVLAGGLAGLAGSCEVLGGKARLFENFSPGYGFDGVAIAFLSRGNLWGVGLTSLFFAALRSGANAMQRSAGVPVTVVYAIQGLTVLFIAINLALEHLGRTRIKPMPPSAKAEIEVQV
ncbi:MAG: ABC transporter permease [Synechococcales cyanobacterium]